MLSCITSESWSWSALRNITKYCLRSCASNIYHKKLKYSDTRKICCNYPKGCTVWFYDKVRCRQNSKQCRPWSDCSSEQSDLGLHCFLDLPVRKLRIIMVHCIVKYWNKQRILHECSCIIEFIKRVGGKKIRCGALPSILSLFPNKFNK